MMKVLLDERAGMTEAQTARRRALAAAYQEVTSGERVRISPTASVPLRVMRLAVWSGDGD